MGDYGDSMEESYNSGYGYGDYMEESYSSSYGYGDSMKESYSSGYGYGDSMKESYSSSYGYGDSMKESYSSGYGMGDNGDSMGKRKSIAMSLKACRFVIIAIILFLYLRNLACIYFKLNVSLSPPPHNKNH